MQGPLPHICTLDLRVDYRPTLAVDVWSMDGVMIFPRFPTICAFRLDIALRNTK